MINARNSPLSHEVEVAPNNNRKRHTGPISDSHISQSSLATSGNVPDDSRPLTDVKKTTFSQSPGKHLQPLETTATTYHHSAHKTEVPIPRSSRIRCAPEIL